MAKKLKMGMQVHQWTSRSIEFIPSNSSFSSRSGITENPKHPALQETGSRN